MLLGGSFSLSRLAPGLPKLDLRWIGSLPGDPGRWRMGRGCCATSRAATQTGRRSCNRPALVRVGRVLVCMVATGRPSVREDADLLLMAGLLAVAGGVLRRCSMEVISSIWTWVFWTAVIYLAAALAAGPGAQGRFAAFGGGPNVFVRVMILGVIAAVYLAVKKRRLFAIGVPWFIIGAVLSGSRGGLLALILVAIPSGFRLVRGVSRRTLATALAVFVVAVGTAPFYASNFLDLVRRRFIEQTLESGYDSGRSQIFVDTWNIASTHVWDGAGLDSYYALVGRVRGYEYPHNIVLESFADGGIISLILLVTAVTSLAVTVMRSGSPLSHRDGCRVRRGRLALHRIDDFRKLLRLPIPVVLPARGGGDRRGSSRATAQAEGHPVVRWWRAGGSGISTTDATIITAYDVTHAHAAPRAPWPGTRTRTRTVVSTLVVTSRARLCVALAAPSHVDDN